MRVFILSLSFIITIVVTGCGMPGGGNVGSESGMTAWQAAYTEFLEIPAKYAEEGHYAGDFTIADMDGDGMPELILSYFNGVEGGSIFANIYIYDGKVKRVDRGLDMYYKSCYVSDDAELPGLFVSGGRNGTFACNYWYIEDGVVVEQPVWTDACDFESGQQKYKVLTDDKRLADAGFKIRIDDQTHMEEVRFFALDKTGILTGLSLYGN